MPIIAISQLPEILDLKDSDFIQVVQDYKNRKISIENLKNSLYKIKSIFKILTELPESGDLQHIYVIGPNSNNNYDFYAFIDHKWCKISVDEDYLKSIFVIKEDYNIFVSEINNYISDINSNITDIESKIPETASSNNKLVDKNYVDSNIQNLDENISNISNKIDEIDNLIPPTATISNKLTDKNYVDDSINSVTAYYITADSDGNAFETYNQLENASEFYSGGELRTPTRNDYCIVREDETHDNATTRYIYNNGWEYQYTVNETALTSDQLAALNSGITANKVAKIDDIDNKQDILISGENIKTINNQNILGSGNISLNTVYTVPFYTSTSKCTEEQFLDIAEKVLNGYTVVTQVADSTNDAWHLNLRAFSLTYRSGTTPALENVVNIMFSSIVQPSTTSTAPDINIYTTFLNRNNLYFRNPNKQGLLKTTDYITAGQKSGTTIGTKATAEGNQTTASGKFSHAEGYMTNATQNNAHAEGNQTTASGNAAHTEGISSVSSGLACHAEGSSQASGNYSHAEGQATKATANRSHAEGYQNEANGECSHAEGRANKSNGANSHTSGQGNIAGYSNQTVVGKYNDNKTDTLFEVGNGTSDNSRNNAFEVTSGGKAIVGTSTSAADSNQTLTTKDYVDGKEPDLSNLVTLDTAQTITGIKTITTALNFTNNNRTGIIENTGDLYNLCLRAPNQNVSVRAAAFIPFGKNASNLGTTSYTWDNGYITNIYGDTGTFTGSVTSGGADYAEYFEWQDGNPDGEDRIGLLVTLDGEKIRLANFGDEILGVTSGTVAFLGDNYETEWQGKYLRDNFGRYIYEEYEYTETEINEETGEEYEVIKHGTRPKLNPNYNPETEYISRSKRAEWETVGMLGKLFVKDDGSCEVNGYVTVGENGIATASVEKTNIRVLARVTDNIIRVLLK